MQLTATILSPIAAILGVVVGGLITARIQQSILTKQAANAVLRDRQEACVEFLTAMRTFRRFVMYTDSIFDEVSPSEGSRGGVSVEGRDEHDARLDQAMSRLMIVSQSRNLIAFAYQMSTDLNKLIRERAQVGRGNIPNETVRLARQSERRFAELVIAELYGQHLQLSDPDSLRMNATT